MKFPKPVDFVTSPLGSLFENGADNSEKNVFKQVGEFAFRILGKIGTNPSFHYFISATAFAAAVSHEDIWSGLVSAGFAGAGTFFVSENMKKREGNTVSYTTKE